ncbi:hypothetical protein GDO81_004185 [Engystomops pustulosus]|uniref:Uncharacterized protein n=1 Tax=Engystomops pustulosus TaxID=76066 RepID=A0AAV6ZZY7_ENGPU|nr:hypothetical protein GDO81_004185 [Engystomops pustulosus]
MDRHPILQKNKILPPGVGRSYVKDTGVFTSAIMENLLMMSRHSDTVGIYNLYMSQSKITKICVYGSTTPSRHNHHYSDTSTINIY